MERPGFMLNLVLMLQRHATDDLTNYYDALLAYETWLNRSAEHDLLRDRYFQTDWMVEFLADVRTNESMATFRRIKSALMTIWELGHTAGIIAAKPSLDLMDAPYAIPRGGLTSLLDARDAVDVLRNHVLAMG